MIKRFIESESFKDETEIFLVNDQSQQKELEIEVKFDNNHRQDLNSKQLKRKYTSEECLPIILYYLGVIASNYGYASQYSDVVFLKIFLSNRVM